MINTLRVSKHDNKLDASKTGKGGEEEEGKEEASKPMDTVPQPPSFVYDYVSKWQKKFEKHIKEREYFKK